MTYKYKISVLGALAVQNIILLLVLLFMVSNAFAHHVLGRPSYSLGEDSNTPPSLQVETQLGDFYITYMAFPAFPKPGDSGRVNLYVKRIDNGATFDGKVTFKVIDDSFFSSTEEILGVQKIDDGVYRQGFVFNEEGNFLISAEFESGGQPYIIDFPLQIGEPFPIGPIGITIFIIALVLLFVNVTQRKRLSRIKANQHHSDQANDSGSI
ncbi:MAG: hypothetical protein ACC653_00330 [Gammaproteobacteria bacterium]